MFIMNSHLQALYTRTEKLGFVVEDELN